MSQFNSGALKPRLKPWLDTFLSVDHNITEVGLQHRHKYNSLSTTRLGSCYLLTLDTTMPPLISDSHPAARQELTGGALFIQHEAVYRPVIIIYNHISYQPAIYK